MKGEIRLPFKLWDRRKEALVYYWRRRNWIKGYSDIENIVRYAYGVDTNDVLQGKVKLLSVPAFSAKYGVNLFTAYKMFRQGRLAGAKVGGRIFLVDLPPQVRRRHQVSVSQAIEKVETWGLRVLGARTVGLVHTPILLLKAWVTPHRRVREVLMHFKQQRRLCVIGRRLHILFSRINGLNLDNIKELYPNPAEIIVPKRVSVRGWGDVKEWEE